MLMLYELVLHNVYVVFMVLGICFSEVVQVQKVSPMDRITVAIDIVADQQTT